MHTNHADILILGAGCAGLSAGIYAARAGKRTVILEKNTPGGQAAQTAQIENYPGISLTDGFLLTQEMRRQAERFGAEVICCDVQSVEPESRSALTSLGRYTGDVMILALGAVPKTLGIPGEESLRGRGVSYCASCDGFFFRDQEIYVVGGGNSAAEEALHLAEIGSRVHLLVRKDALRCDAAIREKLLDHPAIQVHYRRELVELTGTEQIETLHLRDTATGERTEIVAPGSGVFIFIGYSPASSCVSGKLALDEDGYIITDSRLQTSVPGVFAAGDVRQKALRQIVTAAADGAEAAFHAVKAAAL